MKPTVCPVCRAPFFEADPRWSWHVISRQWRHNCVLSAPVIGGPTIPTPADLPDTADIELQLGSRANSVVIMISTMVNQIAVDPGAALEIARGLIMHAARAGVWNDCRADLPNLVREMRRMQMDLQMKRAKQSANAIPPEEPKALPVVRAAVDCWIDRFDTAHRPALKTLEETDAQPAPGPPS